MSTLMGKHLHLHPGSQLSSFSALLATPPCPCPPSLLSIHSSWFQEFKADVRNSSAIVRAVESGIRGVGSATLSATSWTTSKLAACYQRGSFSRPSIGRRRQLKRRNSDEDLLAAASDAEASPAQGEGDDGLPLSSSAPAGSGMDLAAAAAGDRGPGGGEAGASWQAQQLRRVTRQITGQGAAMLSSTSQVLSCTGQLAASGTTSVLRSTSGLLRRIWPSSGAVAGDGSEAAVGEAAGGGGSPPAAATEAAAPGPMDIEEDDEDEEAAAMLLDELEGEEGGGGRASVSYEEQRHMRVQLEME